MDSKKCPFAEFYFWDIMISGMGNYECHSEKRGMVTVDQYGGKGYDICENFEKYLDCRWYQEEIECESSD